MSLTLLTHATGLAALGLNLAGLMRRCDVRLRRCQGLSAVLWALNNLLLGSTAAAALSIVSASRHAAADISSRHGDRATRFSCVAFVLLSAAVGAATWQGWPTLLATAASVVTSYAMFYMSGARLRAVMLFSAVLWSYNAWATHSLEQIAANTLSIAASAYGAWRARSKAGEAARVPSSSAQPT
jgi:inner membrane protein